MVLLAQNRIQTSIRYQILCVYIESRTDNKCADTEFDTNCEVFSIDDWSVTTVD